MSNTDNDLTYPKNFKAKNVKFSKPVKGSIPNMNPPVNFYRINIKIKREDGSIGDLLIPTEILYSFGVQQNENPDTGKINGYSISLCMWNRDGATEKEKQFVDTLEKIVEECKKHLLDNKDDIEMYDLEPADLKKLNPLWWKREKGKIVEGKGPVLYPKLWVDKRGGDIKIKTPFNNLHDTEEEIEPLDIIGKHTTTQALIKIESIWIGNKISLQVKVEEALVELKEQRRKRRLVPQTRDPIVSEEVLKLNNNDKEESDKEESDKEESEKENESSEDISSDEEEIVKEPPKQTRKKVVRKKVVKK